MLDRDVGWLGYTRKQEWPPSIFPSLQDAFLHHLRENKIPVLMFLANGVRLQGYIRSFDKFSIQLARGDSSQVVLKHAISAINPEDDMQLTGPTGESYGS